MLPEIDIKIIDKAYKNEFDENIAKLYPELSWINFNHKCHYEIAYKELGVKYKRSPKEIAKIFGWSLSNTITNLLN